MANHGHEYAQNDKQQKNGEREGISRGDRESRGVRGLAVEIGRIGRWAGKNRIDCLNRSGKSRTDCRIVRFESRVVHAEASPTPDTPDLHGQTQQPEVCRGTRTAAIQSCRRMFFTTKHTKTGFVGHKRRLGKDVVPMLQPRFHLSAPHQWSRWEGRNSLRPCPRPCPQACRLRSRKSATLPTRPNVDAPLDQTWMFPLPADVDAPK